MKSKRKVVKVVPTVVKTKNRVCEIYHRQSDDTWTVLEHITHRGLTKEEADSLKKEK